MAKTLIEKIESLIPLAAEQEKLAFEIIDKSLNLSEKTTLNTEEKEHLQLTSLKLLKRLCFVDLDKVIGRLLKYLDSNHSTKIKEQVISILDYIVEPRLYDLNDVKVFSTEPQAVMLKHLKKLSKKRFIKEVDVYLKLIGKMLQLEFTETQMTDYRTMTFRQISFPKMKHLVKLRNDVFSYLNTQYLLCKDNSIRLKILRIMSDFTKTPISAGYSDEVENMVVDNSRGVIQFFNDVYPNSTEELKSEIDDQVAWIEKRFTKIKFTGLEHLRQLIERDSEYKVYKTLVGYERYRDIDKSWSEIEIERKEDLLELVGRIQAEDWSEWKKKIQGLLNSAISDDLGKYRYLSMLFKELSREDYSKGLELLKLNNLSWFLGDIYSGLLEADKDKAYVSLENEIKHMDHLDVIAHMSIKEPDFPPKLVSLMYKTAIKEKQIDSVRYLIRMSLKHFQYKDFDKKDLFHGLKFLTENKIPLDRWELYEMSDEFLAGLTGSERLMILSSFLLSKAISYEQEEILFKLMEINPKDILDFWKERILIGSKDFERRDVTDLKHYDAIPYNFHHDTVVWDKNAKLIIPEIINLMKKKNWYFKWEGAQLIKAAYPSFNKVLSKAVIDLGQRGSDNDFEILFRILNVYEGNEFVLPTVFSLINIPIDKKLWKDLFIVISNTGVVHGEYGFVNEYQKKKISLENKLKRGNSLEKEFLDEYYEYINSRISYEKKRADLDVYTMRKIF